MSKLKELRKAKGLTQESASVLLGVSLRSYKTYENDEGKIGTLKYNYMVEQLEKYVTLDEEHGLLTIEDIKNACKTVLSEFSVKYCILFGSYAKGKATEKSDVDLLISTEVTGLRFFGIAERLRNTLRKKVDLLDLRQLTDNQELLDEILKDGIRVYE
jgi:predicted nucleotidyltransferase/DNA-binding XRE family transcriptional regulator